jgi:hypothetical protein
LKLYSKPIIPEEGRPESSSKTSYSVPCMPLCS